MWCVKEAQIQLPSITDIQGDTYCSCVAVESQKRWEDNDFITHVYEYTQILINDGTIFQCLLDAGIKSQAGSWSDKDFDTTKKNCISVATATISTVSNDQANTYCECVLDTARLRWNFTQYSANEPTYISQLKTNGIVDMCNKRAYITTIASPTPTPATSIDPDNTVPLIYFSQIPGSLVNTSNLTVIVQANEQLKSALCLLDETISLSCVPSGIDNQTVNISLTSLSETSHTVSVVAFDMADNASSKISTAFTVDLTGPTLSFTATPSASNFTTVVNFCSTFTWHTSATDVFKYQTKVDSDNYQDSSQTSTQICKTEGSHTFYVRSVDNLENTGNTISYNWTITNRFQVSTINGNLVAEDLVGHTMITAPFQTNYFNDALNTCDQTTWAGFSDWNFYLLTQLQTYTNNGFSNFVTTSEFPSVQYWTYTLDYQQIVNTGTTHAPHNVQLTYKTTMNLLTGATAPGLAYQSEDVFPNDQRQFVCIRSTN